MEISYIDEKNVRLKGKQVSLTTQLGKAKNPSDSVLLIGKEHSTEYMSKDSGVVFQGAGEYEIKGTKVTGFTAGDESMYTVRLDGLTIFVGPVSAALIMKDKLHEHDVVVLLADDILTEPVMAVFNARVFVLFGEKAQENMKAREKESPAVNKYVVTKDKLPTETEFVLLG